MATTLTAEQIEIVLAEIEQRWRSRVGTGNIMDIDPGYRVPRSEIRGIISNLGFGQGEPIGDDDFDRAVFKMFDRLRKEFPDERWEPRRNWTAATKTRRKELGLR